ncbi:hypothetical protein FXN61_16570 [Lentzea sp. PSKA42]|uniref:Intein C-terminal splicing domain-containing protein n=2 Tax=Lentzea indica TaxID=2604800 RepID=A0ABX1FHF3_9PSEU|nr:polymorphic toxin-type HINT domain-containing protein [Lentzea indica]NKE58350.1 hypothetical protein [Lentzea indica]
MADGSTKRIDEVRLGDQVLATDPETGESGVREVTATIIGEDVKFLVEIEVDGAGKIVATDRHPFWLPDENRWADAKDLRTGSVLRTSAGTSVQITAIKKRTAIKRVHNLAVDDIHTYYVVAGSTSVLVHNTGPCGVDLDAMSKSGMRPDKGKKTRAGRECQKHMDRGDLDVVPGKKLDSAGQNLLDDIFTNPGTVSSSVTSGNFAGGTRYIMPDSAGGRGYGATFDANGDFQYFGRY